MSHFTLTRSQTIDSLNITIEEYLHNKTGATHYHLATDNDENVFLVALRTVPQDSTGVAHILEHTALCGSERYPVRDPFFLMIRRSLNTFMNAFTSSDWTAYPFASQNKKDFNNLLDVYLDAVFFARLHRLDFAQEGHRMEFSEHANPNSDLIFKGVVFNEMKGAMSSVTSTLWQTLCTHLYPTTTYHYNSGGEPKDIPNLSYESLQAFYRTHYHPSNAMFMTYGDIPAAAHQARFEERVLTRFDRSSTIISVTKEQRFNKPLSVQESYAFNEQGSATNKAHIVMGWLLGESTDLYDKLKAQLLSNVLLDNSASPLQRVLETTELGSAPSPLCGLESSMREMAFVCGIEGSHADAVPQLEQLVLATLQEIAEHGLPQDQVEAVLHQLELHQREIGGDNYPFGLQLILTALSSAIHRGDPIASLNLDPAIEQLRCDIQDPDFIKQLTRELLLNNTHRITLLMTPDATLNQQRDQAEADQLAHIKAKLSAQETQAIIDQAQALAKRQTEVDDESVLPKVSLADVPADIRTAHGQSSSLSKTTLHSYSRSTNGLVYQQLLIELPKLSPDLLALLPHYSNSLTEVGNGDHDYLATQSIQAQVCGDIHAYYQISGMADNVQASQNYLVLSSKALYRNQQSQAQLMKDTLLKARFDEQVRLQELLSQQRAFKEQSVTSQGHSLAMTAASRGMSPAARIYHELSGLQSIQAIKALDQRLNNDTSARQYYAKQLEQIHQHVLTAPREYLLITDAQHMASCKKSLELLWDDYNPHSTTLVFDPVHEISKQVWIANTQVNFCAKAYPTVNATHTDAAALSVLAVFLRNGFLHRVIREQGGAYGGGAKHNANIAAFQFYSYRDPRLAETLVDFDRSIDWLCSTTHSNEALEQAILGIIGTLDKPGSPAGEAKHVFHNERAGHSEQQRRTFRQRVLNTTIDDLQRVANTYLKPEQASTATITHETGQQQLNSWVSQEDVDVFYL